MINVQHKELPEIVNLADDEKIKNATELVPSKNVSNQTATNNFSFTLNQDLKEKLKASLIPKKRQTKTVIAKSD